MELKNKTVFVAGTGISGIGAAKLLDAVDANIILYDGKESLKKEDVQEKLGNVKAEIVIGELTDDCIEKCDLCILSPGISAFGPLANRFTEKNIPIWGEIELAYAVSKGKIAAITGTNGKTTTTALVGEILKAYYESTFVVGNIGIPFTNVALDTREDTAIAAEISSFQLETIHKFHPAVSAVLNITPDHLDRHGTLQNYADTKLKISMNQTKDDVIVLNYDDEMTKDMANRTNARVVFFSRLTPLEEGICLIDKKFVIREEGKEIFVCNLDDLKLLGGHNHENVLAAIGITYYMGVPADVIGKVATSFAGVEHRIEYVDTINGVAYYNDSKGTNPDAAIKGIQAMKTKTVLIGGGYDKGASYKEWIEAFDGKVKKLVLVGATAQKIQKDANECGFYDTIIVDTFEEAVMTCAKEAKEGESVLLSPACASWGMFPNFEVRGKVFKELVKSLKG
ncbi:MAG: UDP-N-acetylmuramoyl-L-alanine--D-glutamate ligase [Lachnospiraceae bacterium]